MDNTDRKMILLVDDEISVLNSITRALLDSAYMCISASNADAAFDLLADHDVDLVISDIHMPRMDGTKFLRTVKRHYPSVIRVLLSDYNDETAIMRAVNENIAKAYLPKPCADHELIRFLDEIFEVDEILGAKNIMDRINALDHLPSLIKSCQSILDEIDGDASPEKVSMLLSNDQSLSGELLRVANSAFFGQRTSSVKSAVIYLGLSNVRTIVLSNIAYNVMKNTQRGVTQLSEKCWQAAFATRKLMEMVNVDLYRRDADPGKACAGLLCNLGTSLMLNHFKAEMPHYEGMLVEEPMQLAGYEEGCVGFTHDTFGASLLHWWGLPYFCVEAALFRRTPLDAKVINGRVVALASLCADAAESWIMRRRETPEMDEAVCATAEVEKDELLELFERAKSDEELAKLL